MIVALIFYNFGWWNCWVNEFLVQDMKAANEEKIVFTGLLPHTPLAE
jgi:hypothetical protein